MEEDLSTITLEYKGPWLISKADLEELDQITKEIYSIYQEPLKDSIIKSNLTLSPEELEEKISQHLKQVYHRLEGEATFKTKSNI